MLLLNLQAMITNKLTLMEDAKYIFKVLYKVCTPNKMIKQRNRISLQYSIHAKKFKAVRMCIVCIHIL